MYPSEDFNSWAGGGTIVQNAIISPDGTQNATKYTSNNTTQTRYQSTSGATACSISMYAKKFDSDYIIISYGQPSTKYAIFRLSDGVCTQSTSGITTSSINVGNGWWRFTLSTATESIGYIEFAPYTNSTGWPYCGGSCYIWGAQYENSSYPTSYIPTTSASATRVADACFKTGISSLIGQTEGVIFVDFNNVTNPEAGDYNMLATISDSANEYIYISKRNPTGFEIYGGVGATTYITSGVFVDGQRYKVALAYKNNDFAVYINGSSIWTDTSGTISVNTPNKLSVGSYYSQILNFNSGINQCALFKTRLTNAELASLTTL
jgi:hypothetical protein